MLNQILQEIKSVPSLVPIYWKAMLIVLHNKYAIQQSLDILIRVKTTRARCAEMLTTLEGYYAELGSTINNNSVIFIKSINFSGLINDALNVLSSCYGVELLEAKQIRIFLDAYGLNIEISNSNELGEKKDALIETLFRTICLLRTLKDTLENNISTEITYYLQQQSISVSEYADVIGIVENMVRYIDVILATVPRHQVYEMLSKVPESRGIIMYNYIYGICAEGHEKSLPSELERAVQLVQLKNRQSIITSFQGDTIYYPEERVYQALPLPIYPVILVNEDNCRTFPRPNQSNPEIIATKPALSEKEKKSASTNALAQQLGTTAASVTDMLKKLAEKGNVKASLRTSKDNVDVKALAERFGGGGHVKAAGIMIKGGKLQKEVKWKIIKEEE
mgnify:CR=1 FL=1